MWILNLTIILIFSIYSILADDVNIYKIKNEDQIDRENKIILKSNEIVRIDNPNINYFARQNSNLRLTIISPLLNRCSMRITCTRSQRSLKNCDEYLEIIQKHDGSVKKVCNSKTLSIQGDVVVRFRQGRQNTLAGILGAGLRSCSFACPTPVRTNDKLPNVPIEKSPIAPILKSEPHACKCGNNGLIKVVNGVEANMGEFPWQVAVVARGRKQPYCGGTLINSKYVLTAAHCVTRPAGLTASRIEIILNEHNVLTMNERNSTRLKVENIIVHPKYVVTAAESRRNGKLFFQNSPFAVNDNDIALLKVKDEVDLTVLPPICLPQGAESSKDFVGSDATISGWGVTAETSTQPPAVLKKTQLKVLSNGNCARNYIIPGLINQRMICASGFQTGSCFGDSGGPLAVKRSRNEYMQIGIVSWGIGCARNYPTVYTRVTEFLPWIYENTADGGYCSN